LCQPLSCTQGSLYFQFDTNLYQVGCPPAPDQNIQLTIARPFTVGQGIDLATSPQNVVSLYMSGPPSGGSCTSWNGTVTVTADVPSWSVTINATCSAGNPALQVVGTVSGNL
jgi:hypothetical protein